MSKYLILRWSGIGLLTAAFCMASPVESNAQETTAIENITVTSRKRTESLQDVPLALDVVTGEELRSRGVTLSGELANLIPNLEWQSIIGQATPQVFLRGIGNNTFNANQANPIAVYTDGVYQGSTLNYGFQLFDVDRVEVLKGPQGTLYGRNTTGGLLNVITQSPDLGSGTSGYGIASYGNYEAPRVEAAVGFDLSPQVAIRVSGVVEQRDGYVENVVPQNGFDDSGELDFWALRGQVLFQPSDATTVRLAIQGGDNESDIIPWKQIGVLCPPAVTVPALGAGCSDFFGFSDTPDLFSHSTNVQAFDHISSLGGRLSFEHAFDGWTVSAQTGVETYDRTLVNDADASPLDALHNDVEAEYWQVSQEISARNNDGGPLDWIVGAFVFFDGIESFQAFPLNDFGPGFLTQLSPFEEGIASALDQETTSYALFGEVDYTLTDRLSVSLGARWTRDQRRATTRAFIFSSDGLRDTFIDQSIGLSRVIFETIPQLSVKETWSEWSGRFVVDYRVDDSTLLFLTGARGFKGGDFNAGALFSPIEANIVDPEFVYSLEGGVKGTWADGVVSGSASVFGYDFKNQQVQVLVPGSNATLQNLANAANTDVLGAELELTVKPVDALTFNLGLGLLDAEFGSFILDASNPAANFDGNRTPFSPKFSMVGAVRYEAPVQFGVAAIQAGWSYRSSRFFTVDNSPVLREDGTWLVDLRLSLTAPDDAWSVALWSENLFDEEYLANGLGNTAFGFFNVMPAVPRTYGISLSTAF